MIANAKIIIITHKSKAKHVIAFVLLFFLQAPWTSVEFDIAGFLSYCDQKTNKDGANLRVEEVGLGRQGVRERSKRDGGVLFI